MYFINFLGIWIIDPPYGIGEEEWDSEPWNEVMFSLVFKKILAIDTRKMIFVYCFGGLFPFLQILKKLQWYFNLNFINLKNFNYF